MLPFIPDLLPPEPLDWKSLVPALGDANRALARYDGVLSNLRSPEILLSPLVTQEAVLSSRIEGTQATLGEVLQIDAGQVPAQLSLNLDFQEIMNYRLALADAEAELARRPFSLNLLRSMHATLLNSVRGQDKGRGEFRRIQNWIGVPGSEREAAQFVPPAPEPLMRHLAEWEAFYHAETPDALVQLAMVHGQFEILHPFLDGNGRLGRILVPLFLFEKKLLSRPMFYLSAYLEKNRESYIAGLRALSRDRERAGAWRDWCEFFLRAIAAQAHANLNQAQAILELYEVLKVRIIELTHSQYAVLLLDAIFERPIFSTTQMAARPNLPSRPMLGSMLNRLLGDGVLRVLREGSGRRPQILVCGALMTLCETREWILHS